MVKDVYAQWCVGEIRSIDPRAGGNDKLHVDYEFVFTEKRRMSQNTIYFDSSKTIAFGLTVGTHFLGTVCGEKG